MKYFLLLSCAFLAQCFGVNLKVTEVIKDHNIYILENKFVIQSSDVIEGLYVGSMIDVDTHAFYGTNQWTYYHYYTVSRYVDTVYTDHYDMYGFYTHTTSYDNYAYDTYTVPYTFYPLGIINKKKMTLGEFTTFALSRPYSERMYSYSTVFRAVEWVGDNIDMKTSYFPTTSVVGQEETLHWLISELQMYEEGYQHKIIPIFDRNYPELLAAVLHLSKKRKVFLHDYCNGLAIFQRE